MTHSGGAISRVCSRSAGALRTLSFACHNVLDHKNPTQVRAAQLNRLELSGGRHGRYLVDTERNCLFLVDLHPEGMELRDVHPFLVIYND